MSKVDDFTKRPLHVFDLPPELLATLQPFQTSPESEPDLVGASTAPAVPPEVRPDHAKNAPTSCGLCRVAFDGLADQRQHFRSDWHGYNLKQNIRGLPVLNEAEFDEIVGELDSSLSGSGASGSEDEIDEPTSGPPKGSQGNTETRQPKSAGSPFVLMSSSLIPQTVHFGVYRALLGKETPQSSDAVNYLSNRQLRPQTTQQASLSSDGPYFLLCMIGGGHFAAMVVSPLPASGKQVARNENQPKITANKTFHRYTTRRKQGGAQSANDAAKGNAHSAGAGIRRANETALQQEVRALLNEWRELIGKCELLFIRASGPANRKTLFGPYEKAVLQSNDPRLRSFPFSTRRPIKRELLRAFAELTKLHVIYQKEDTLTAKRSEGAEARPLREAPRRPVEQKRSEEEEEAFLHTTQLQALIRRSKAPAVLNYLEKNGLRPDITFYPPDSPANYHAPTPLHLASKVGSAAVVLSLLTKGQADPTIVSKEGKTAFDLGGDKPTRNSFRVARSELGENRWDWEAAHCPPALSKAEADERERSEKLEAEKAETARRQAEAERLEAEERKAGSKAPERGPGKNLGGEVSGSDLREQEARGLPPEIRMRMERERRARAAEERLKKLAIR